MKKNKKNKYSIINKHITEKNKKIKNRYKEIQNRINDKNTSKSETTKKHKRHYTYFIVTNEFYSFFTALFICMIIFILTANNVIEKKLVEYHLDKTIYKKLELLFNSNTYRINAIIEHSKNNGFHPLLTASIIYMESANNVYEISRVNARGLMQVRRETGYDSARWQGKKFLAYLVKHFPYILHVPDINIELATFYIKRYKKLFRLNWRAALHAYNVGPTAYRRGQRHHYYVNRIMQFYNDFKRLSLEQISEKYYSMLIYIFKPSKKILN